MIKEFFEEKIRFKSGNRLFKSEVYTAYVNYCRKNDKKYFKNGGFWRLSQKYLYDLGAKETKKKVVGYPPIKIIRNISIL